MNYTILEGDNRDTLKTIPDSSIDSIVTDPPYGIDFLGKTWDANTGALETYQECLRVLKPGGYILAFSAARTYHHLAVTLEQAGFEIRDQLMWIYSSGFPKAQAIPDAPGWKTALKPAHEPICLARKPFRGSTRENMAQWGVGALNIDATRIPSETLVYPSDGIKRLEFNQQQPKRWEGDTTTNDQGRYPSNVIGEIEGYQKFFYCPKVSRKERHAGFDDPGPRHPGADGGGYQVHNVNELEITRGEAAGVGNNHPTVKPVELMKYLIKLVTPENGVVLDPFNGSGSTGMAATELGHTYIGCELDPNYAEISRKRILAWSNPEYDNLFGELFETI